MNNNIKKTILLSAGILSIGIGVGLGFSLQHIKTLKISSTPERMENSIIISNLLQKVGDKDFISKSDFDKSFKLIDKDGKEITEYSHLTVEEAYKDNLFKFELPKKVKFFVDKYGVDIFVKSYIDNGKNPDIFSTYYNSSTPEFKIWFGKGVGENRVEDFLTITGAGFYGFKKTSQESDVNNMINIFSESFSLKKEFYIDENNNNAFNPGLYAKNIKKEDIISNMNLSQLNNVNWKITSVSQDSQIPSKLIVTIDFNKGILNKNYYSETYKKFEINNFDVELGVDDPISKVKNFIKDQKNIIGINEAFVFKKENSDDAIGTVLESYEKGLFDFVVPASYKNRASNAGVEYVFKKYDNENKLGDSAFPDENNSTIPKFKIYIRTGFGTAFEYEEFFTVTGSGQVTNIEFKPTNEANYLESIIDANFQDITKISLINEFKDFNILDPNNTNNKFKIPTNIIANVMDAQKNVELKISDILPNEIPKPEGTFIYITITKIESNNDILVINSSVCIGDEFKNKSSFNKTFKFDYFISEKTYNENLIGLFTKKIEENSSNKNVAIVTNNLIENKAGAMEDINKSNGNFYFVKNVLVGYDSIMSDFKWSNKPVFEIDFSKTKVVIDSGIIKFWVDVSSSNAQTNIIIERNIDDFIA